jgi:chemotaxis response regulator CheB
VSHLHHHTPHDGLRFQRGRVYVAPPDQHMIVERGDIRLEHSPKESAARPSVDALFRSAAYAYGRRVVGVLLTGMRTDGAVGLWQIRKYGGTTIVQDPAEATYPEMPQNALATVEVHHCLKLAAIAPALIAHASGSPAAPVLSGPRPARVLIVENDRVLARRLANRVRELGYVVAGSVASGEKAIALTPQVSPDVVLMDVLLDGRMRGTQAARLMWHQHQVPVVYLTACSDDSTLSDADMSVPYTYVVRPYRPEQLHAALRVALDRHDREAQCN